ncbi:hypothetical protein CCR82_06900 [Halochromatium salexigens]|uniref:Uncharacterized protein n=2 Tax=Halochromatium salexigens TaxID=49447 RepID=A0AAJ0UF15_HALSE|nr:hypothetical protein [Halochromatium salexigens]
MGLLGDRRLEQLRKTHERAEIKGDVLTRLVQLALRWIVSDQPLMPAPMIRSSVFTGTPRTGAEARLDPGQGAC